MTQLLIGLLAILGYVASFSLVVMGMIRDRYVWMIIGGLSLMIFGCLLPYVFTGDTL